MVRSSYSHFTNDDLASLNLQLNSKTFLFDVAEIQPSDWLKQAIDFNLRIPMATEKAKSELLVVPILHEMRRRNNESFTFFSGYNFDVDKSRGLKGHCDFLLTLDQFSLVINEPVFAIVEAKNGEIEPGIAQCAAQMLAARLFNEKKGHSTPVIFGAVTTGHSWLFLKLEGDIVYSNTRYFTINQLAELLGAIQFVLDFFKK